MINNVFKMRGVEYTIPDNMFKDGGTHVRFPDGKIHKIETWVKQLNGLYRLELQPYPCEIVAVNAKIFDATPFAKLWDS